MPFCYADALVFLGEVQPTVDPSVTMLVREGGSAAVIAALIYVVRILFGETRAHPAEVRRLFDEHARAASTAAAAFASAQQAHAAEVKALQAGHVQQILDLQKGHAEELRGATLAHAAEEKALHERYLDEMRRRDDASAAELRQARERYDAAIDAVRKAREGELGTLLEATVAVNDTLDRLGITTPRSARKKGTA